jgi:hypothetical protein
LFLSKPVITRIEKAMRRAHAPRRVGEKRRHGERESVPDVTFRWRTRSHGSPARDPQR